MLIRKLEKLKKILKIRIPQQKRRKLKYILARSAMVGIRNTAAACLSPLRPKSCLFASE